MVKSKHTQPTDKEINQKKHTQTETKTYVPNTIQGNDVWHAMLRAFRHKCGLLCINGPHMASVAQWLGRWTCD